MAIFKITTENTGDIYLESIELNKSILSLDVGDTFKLTTKLYPEDLNVPVTLSFSSSNSSVATVDQNGLIIAVGTGAASIKVKSDTGIYRDCFVRVFKNQESNVGEVTSAKLIINGQDATDGTVKIKKNGSYKISIETMPSKAIYEVDYKAKTIGGENSVVDIRCIKAGVISVYSWENWDGNTFTNSEVEMRTYFRTGSATVTATINDVNNNEIVLTGTVIVE